MSRWLLLLGSNHDGEAQLQAAKRELTALGHTQTRAGPARFEADGGAQGYFHNALVALQAEAERAQLAAELKAIEGRLGRDRSVPGRVAIDIDILARRVNDAWRYDPHAVAKGEPRRTWVRDLLATAEVEIKPPD